MKSTTVRILVVLAVAIALIGAVGFVSADTNATDDRSAASSVMGTMAEHAPGEVGEMMHGQMADHAPGEHHNGDHAHGEHHEEHEPGEHHDGDHTPGEHHGVEGGHC